MLAATAPACSERGHPQLRRAQAPGAADQDHAGGRSIGPDGHRGDGRRPALGIDAPVGQRGGRDVAVGLVGRVAGVSGRGSERGPVRADEGGQLVRCQVGGLLRGCAPGQAPQQALGLLDRGVVGGPHEQLVADGSGGAVAR
jgi:hypothetical protein